ncbi:MAG: 2-oxo acid dehydrogenase subunit E2 [Puniceicoccaceae bacterium]
MIEIRLPKPGPEIENATITRWQCKEGDKIQIGAILAIIKTPIGSFKVAAEEQGILESILQGDGATIDFDEPIAIMHPDLTITDFPNMDDEQDHTLPLPIDTDASESSPPEEEVPESVGQASSEPENPEDSPDTAHSAIEDSSVSSETDSTEIESGALRLKLDPEASLDSQDVEQETDTPEHADAPTSEVSAEETESGPEVSPAARKMAERMGLDLRSIRGSGDHGKILYIDVENAIQERDQAKENPPAPETAETPAPSLDDAAPVIPSEATESQPTLTPIAEHEAPVEPGGNDFSDPLPETAQSQDSDSSTPAQTTPPQSEDASITNSMESDFDFDPTASSDPTPDTRLANANPKDSTWEIGSIEPEQTPDAPMPDFGEVASQFHLSKRDDLIIPFNATKRAFAESQLESTRSVPHFYLFAEIDWTDALKWLHEQHQRAGIKVKLTDLIVKATGQALAIMPEMNACVRNDRMILKRSINIGISTPCDDGVVTPVIPDVYHKSIEKIAEVVKKNTDLAVRSKVLLDYDTTFTVTVMEHPAIHRMIPLITAPQTGALAVGSIRPQVVPFGDFIAIRKRSELTLACDSRAIDPQNAARFLQTICNLIEALKPGEADPDWTCGNEQLRLI